MNCSAAAEARETEAEAEVEVPGGEYRVRVSMERYYSDERARCYMSVSRARPVRSLARRLRRTFSLPRPFALLSRGHLLPPDEPLALLAPDDPVEVVPIKYVVPEKKKASVQPSSTPVSVIELPKRCTTPDVLQDLKRRALELLEEHEAPPRRRRRVRRRRRGPAAPGGEDPAADSEDPAVEMQALAIETQAPAVETQAPAVERQAPVVEPSAPAPEPARPPVVLRNGAANPRAARLVRPLPAPASVAPNLDPPAPASPSMSSIHLVTLPAAVFVGRT